MDSVFITGTAGAGKSLLTSRLFEMYEDNGTLPITINLDPGVTNIPYSADIDIRNYIDINEIM